MRFAPKLVRKVWDKAAGLGHGAYFPPQGTGEVTDDHTFINHVAKIPTMDIIEYGPESDDKFFGGLSSYA